MRRRETQDWTFGGLWPYAPRWFDTPDGRIHYVDEGPRDGQPVVLVHGNPTWGFLYRHFIPPLVEAGYRVIVPDCLGFGRSDKPARPDAYRPATKHVERMEALLDSLDLRDATVVPQDWGGPIGLGWAVHNPDRVARLFILNTYVHRPRGALPIPLPLRFFRMPGVGELLVQGLGLFHRVFLFKAGMIHRERLTPQVKRAYMAPHRTWKSRTAVLAFPREIPLGPYDGPIADLCGDLEEGMERELRDRPVRIVWAMDDPAFLPWGIEEMWLRTFPHAEVVRLEGASHYLQEDAYERIVPQLLDFLASTGPGARARDAQPAEA